MGEGRKWLARRIWDFAAWLYPDEDYRDDSEEQQGWEATFYFEADQREADRVFERLTDATCGSDHHALDPCPGPSFVAGMHPAEPS